MLNLLLFLVFIACLSLLCVFIANIKVVIPDEWKDIVVFRSKDHLERTEHKRIVQDYEPHRRNNPHPSRTHSWSVGITGHS